MKVIDSFLFFQELDIVEIRFNELNDCVDQFLVVEIPITLQGHEKPLTLTNALRQGRFDKFKKKIKIITASIDEIREETIIIIMRKGIPWEKHSARKVENFQRNLIWKQVNYMDDAILIHGDVDEIPKAKIVQEFVSSELSGAILETQLYRYFYNLYFQLWGSLFITRMDNKDLKDVKCLSYFREKVVDKQWPRITNAGWHFSSVGSLDFIVEKMKSVRFSPGIKRGAAKSKADIARKIQKRSFDSLRKGEAIGQVHDIDELPLFIKENLSRFEDLILEEPS